MFKELKGLNFKQYMLYAGVSREEYMQVLPDINKSNRSKLVVFTPMAICYFILMVVLAFNFNVLVDNRYVYVVALGLMTAVFVITLSDKKENPKLISCMVHMFTLTLFALSIIIGTITSRDEQGTTFIVLLVTLPMVFTRRPIENIAGILCMEIIYIVMAVMVKETHAMTMDIINAMVFGGVSSMVSSYMMNVMVENYSIKQKFSVMAKTDQLTGLKNRNWYEQKITEYPTLCQESLTCIYADINGLHDLNNSKGHEKGDIMLKFIAKEFQDHFGEEDSYRIGGDEYVAFAIDTDEEVFTQKVDSFLKKIEEKNYHAAVGYKTQEAQAIDIAELVRGAEKNMYEAKIEFYTQAERDRRNRRNEDK